MKKFLIIVFLTAGFIGVAHAQTSTTITQDTANTARATCFSNGGSVDECTAVYNTYLQSVGTAVPNTTAQTPQATGASGFVPLAEIPGLTDQKTTSVVNSDNLALFFNNLYKYLIGLAAAFAVIEIIWGGLEISTKDSVSKQSDGKARITQAVFGLILVLSPVLVFSIINPAILNLSINLPPLDTKSGTSSGLTSGAAPSTPITDPSSGCTVSSTSSILQFATCPSSAAATTWGQQNCTTGNFSSDQVVSPTNGVSTNIATCSSKQSYVFIDPGLSRESSINRLRPLVRADIPNNASDAINFANICRSANLGRKTCISTAPWALSLIRSNVDCQLTGTNAATTWKCYNETLTCGDKNFVSSLTSSDVCVDGPSWTPFP